MVLYFLTDEFLIFTTGATVALCIMSVIIWIVLVVQLHYFGIVRKPKLPSNKKCNDDDDDDRTLMSYEEERDDDESFLVFDDEDEDDSLPPTKTVCDAV